ncbi:MAG: hypothetical protein GYB26_09950 [Gammaproteobacteria bacterium]|nr:hypothetical protein [Gammaproteobacteria bacterium]
MSDYEPELFIYPTEFRSDRWWMVVIKLGDKCITVTNARQTKIRSWKTVGKAIEWVEEVLPDFNGQIKVNLHEFVEDQPSNELEPNT